VARNLILVRHSLPTIDPRTPAPEWRLSDEGRQRCERLAAELALFRPEVVVSSREPKAVETGQIVAHHLGLPCEVAPGLHEHDRRHVAPFEDVDQFQEAVASLFERPHDLVFGAETAQQALGRFAHAVEVALARHSPRNVAIVSHGTVMTLFVARATGLAPFPFWQSLGLPAFVVLSHPALELQAVVGRVG
jgi:broad specificity phosphatase PhoE